VYNQYTENVLYAEDNVGTQIRTTGDIYSGSANLLPTPRFSLSNSGENTAHTVFAFTQQASVCTPKASVGGTVLGVCGQALPDMLPAKRSSVNSDPSSNSIFIQEQQLLSSM
jgi:hypothetical protein